MAVRHLLSLVRRRGIHCQNIYVTPPLILLFLAIFSQRSFSQSTNVSRTLEALVVMHYINLRCIVIDQATCAPMLSNMQVFYRLELVSWSLTSLFSTNMAISEMRFTDWKQVSCHEAAVSELQVVLVNSRSLSLILLFLFVCRNKSVGNSDSVESAGKTSAACCGRRVS